jgi:AbrB family looped-hinge helix DNA binding protein
MKRILYVDRAGRLVIPKWAREQFGLQPGQPLELIAAGDELRLRPQSAYAAVVQGADGSVEFDGVLPSAFDVVDAVDRARAERIRSPSE